MILEVKTNSCYCVKEMAVIDGMLRWSWLHQRLRWGVGDITVNQWTDRVKQNTKEKI